MMAVIVARSPLTLTRKFNNLGVLSVRGFDRTASPSTNIPPKTTPHEASPAGRIQAWQLLSYGKESELMLSTSHPEPIVRKPNDVKIEILATSVNPLDLAMMEGYGNVLLNSIYKLEHGCSGNRSFPIILGRDFVGRVEATGLGVSNVKVDDEVWGVIAPWSQGAHAKKIVVSAQNVRRKPQNLSATDMAALPYVSVTAWSALQITGEMACESQGKRVLILGGAGGVGSAAIQLARAWKAYVVTTCRTDAIPLVESLGANGVVDYTQPDFIRKIKEHGHFDVVLDAAGVGPDAGLYADCINHWSNAKYVTLNSPVLRNIDQYGLAFGMIKNISALVQANLSTGLVQKGATSRWGYFIPTSACLDDICQLAESGKLTPIVQEIFPFRSMPDAFRRLRQGHLRGKIVVQCGI